MIRGDVVLRIECLMPERLLMRALETGAVFAHAEHCGGHTITVSCDHRSAEILLGICRRFSISANVVAIRGADALRNWFNGRGRTLLPALLLCGVMTFLFLSRIWIIRIDTAEAADRSLLETVLEDLDIRPGLDAAKIDAKMLALRIGAQAGGFSFVSVHREGIELIITAVRENAPPEIFHLENARDLVADRDGIVLSVTPLSGEAVVSVGDVVRRGDVLIRGEEHETRDTNRGVAALGEVIARAWQTGSARLPAKTVRREYTGRHDSALSLCMFRLETQISEREHYASEELQRTDLPIGGMFLPLVIRRTSAAEYREITSDADSDKIKADTAVLAFAEALAAVDPDGKHPCQITEKWIDYHMTEEGELAAEAVVEYTTDIAATRESLLQGG